MRYQGHCDRCGVVVLPGEPGFWHAVTKKVRCSSCSPLNAPAERAVSGGMPRWLAEIGRPRAGNSWQQLVAYAYGAAERSALCPLPRFDQRRQWRELELSEERVISSGGRTLTEDQDLADLAAEAESAGGREVLYGWPLVVAADARGELTCGPLAAVRLAPPVRAGDEAGARPGHAAPPARPRRRDASPLASPRHGAPAAAIPRQRGQATPAVHDAPAGAARAGHAPAAVAAQPLRPPRPSDPDPPEPEPPEPFAVVDDLVLVLRASLDERHYAGLDLEEVQPLLDQPLPSGDPGAVADLLTKVADTAGMPVHEPLDPHHLATGPLPRVPGVYNRAMALVRESDQITRSLRGDLREMYTARPEEWRRTAARFLLEPAGPTVASDLPVVTPVPLNAAQERGVRLAIGSPLTVITGPPGTGKSQLIAALVATARAAGMTALVASTNNGAVDVAARRASAAHPAALLRTGSRRHRTQLAARLVRLIEDTGPPSRDPADTLAEVTRAAAARARAEADSAAHADELVRLHRLAREVTELAGRLWGETGHHPAEPPTGRPVGAAPGSPPDAAPGVSSGVSSGGDGPAAEPGGPTSRARHAAPASAPPAPFAHAPSADPGAPPAPRPERGAPPPATPSPPDGAALDVAALRERAERVAEARVAAVRRARRLLTGAGVRPELLRDPAAALETLLRWADGRLELDRAATDPRYGARAWLAEEDALRGADRSWAAAGREHARTEAAHRLQRGRPRLTRLLQLCRADDADPGRALQEAMAVLPAWGTSTLSTRPSFGCDPALFDLVIVDEASQCPLAHLLPLAYRARRLVVIGDPHQLPPVVTTPRHEAEAVATAVGWDYRDLVERHLAFGVDSAYTTLAARLPEPPHLLDEHYRCHPRIADYLDRTFYSGRLGTLTDVAALPAVPEPGLHWHTVTGGAAEGTPGGGGRTNRAEAAAVRDWVREHADRLVAAGAGLGVVTPFAAQARLLESVLRGVVEEERRRALGLRVGTAHVFQGDERDVMLFSPVVAEGMPAGSAGWINDNAYLVNVAASRARAALVVFGDAAAAERFDIPALVALHRAATDGAGPAASAPLSDPLAVAHPLALADGAAEPVAGGEGTAGADEAAAPGSPPAVPGAGPGRLLALLREPLAARGCALDGPTRVAGYAVDALAHGADGTAVALRVDGHAVDGPAGEAAVGRTRRHALQRDRVVERSGTPVLRIAAWRLLADREAVAEEVLHALRAPRGPDGPGGPGPR
ncbi:DEAD/DEAH box helicase [Allostreptomyces psammosilenae]|uniref:AAA+ ATPase domain-containing protein n=1 Tax=Allostreptomyces psammosilenae TaxID=1892865 RepID=A0A852ZUU8_9ACTN|nr:AAA domain-containing protein [Allostreptomyces psammosilenae]NYI05050.1 hypothetical protein [Allostreptomyces psammosilenae]